MRLFDWHAKQIQDEADRTLKKLGDGAFSDNETAKQLVQYRKGLLFALDVLRKAPKSNDDTEDV